ncbi:MAG: glutathione peroxidase, partial [Ignavibacteriaceae bacterium]
MKLENIKIIIIAFVLSLQLGGFYITVSQNIGGDNLKDNINDITVMDMGNNSIQLSDYNGKVLLIVNVASECGFTPQYKGLEEIYLKYNSLGFEILAFPCNDFGGQEPGTNEEIKAFCSSNYNVTFKLFDKIKVLGEDKSPLY